MSIERIDRALMSRRSRQRVRCGTLGSGKPRMCWSDRLPIGFNGPSPGSRPNPPPRPPLTATQKVDAMFAWMGLGFTLLILTALFLIGIGFSPGHQSEIAAEFKAYRALRHDAVAVEWR